MLLVRRAPVPAVVVLHEADPLALGGPGDDHRYRINAGNCVSLALNQGYGWASDVNLGLLFDQLFSAVPGEGYPVHRAEPQRTSRELLSTISRVTHRSMAEIVADLPEAIVSPVLSHPAGMAALDVPTIPDPGLRGALQARMVTAGVSR